MRLPPGRSSTIHILFLLSFGLLLLVFAKSSEAQAQPVATDPAAVPSIIPPTPQFRASPRVIQPVGGKLPSSVTLAVLKNCDDPRPPADLTGHHLVITGNGLSLAGQQQNSSKCVIQTSLSIDANTPPGTYSLIIEDSTGKPDGYTEISVLDNAAAAIPPGLPPEVDVIWGVMSQNNCADVFGNRVAQSLYCIQIKIGNNSGHPLQIAGVGFAESLKALALLGIPQVTVANTSYASARAVLVQSQVWSTRNLLYNSISGTGLIMAGFTPYFARPNAKAHFATGASIVSGALLQAFNLVAPDPIVNQLKSLDDQTFRDNMVIPNNAQVQTVVFIEKQNLTQALRELMLRLGDAATNAQITMEAAKKNTADAEASAAAAEAKASSAFEKNVKPSEDAHAYAGTSLLELQKDAKQKRLAATEAKISEERLSSMITVLGEMAGSVSGTVTNSRRQKFGKGNPDPLLVKLALGSLVVVGDEIEYLQRVQIQTNAAGSAVAVAINPAAPQIPVGGAQAFTATMTNDQNSAGVTWSLSGPNCKDATCGTLASATSTTVAYTAPAAQPSPNNTVTITATSKADSTKSGTGTITITPAMVVTISPKPASVTHGGAPITFTANVQNDPKSAVIWDSLSGIGCTGAACGTLVTTAATAVYTPPAGVPSPNTTVTITAKSAIDGTKIDAVTIKIN
jgi:hypothetical protein